MAKIKSLTVVTNEGTQVYSVGRGWPTQATRKITKILDRSLEYIDTIHFIYEVKDQNNELIAAFNNVPLIVEYNEN